MENKPQVAPDYSFLENPNNTGGPLGDPGKKRRILTVAAGGGVLLVLIILVFSLIFGGNVDTKEHLVRIAQQQQEIIRLAEKAIGSARESRTASFANTTKAAIESSQKQVTGAVANKGVRLRQADLRLRENRQYTSQLNAAEQANQFDAVYMEIMNTLLDEYLAEIRIAAQRASGSDLVLLQALEQEAVTLIEALE